MDWSKLLFQIMNFVVMLFILYRLLFKSVSRALDKRSKRVIGALDDAEERVRKAAETCTEYQERSAKMQEYIDSLTQETKEELWRTRKQVLAETRREIQVVRQMAEQEIEEARQKATYEHQCQLGRLVTTQSGRLIREVGGDAFQEACIEQFLKQLPALPTEEYRYVSQDDEERAVRVQLASAHELNAASVARLREQAQEIVGQPVEMICKVDPILVAGVTMRIGDTVIDGSVAGSLQGLYEHYLAGLAQEAEDK